MKKHCSSWKHGSAIRIGAVLFAMVLLAVPLIQAQEPLKTNPKQIKANVYVTNQGRYGEGNTVQVIDSLTNAITATITVDGTGPYAIALTPNGKLAYVLCITGSVSVIELATNTVVAIIPVEPYSNFLAIDPDGAYAYVTLNDVTVIDIATNTVIGTIGPIPGGAASITIAPNGDFAYVSQGAAKAFSVIDLNANTVVATIPFEDDIFSIGVASTPKGDFAYVPQFHLNKICVVDLETYDVVAEVPVGDYPMKVAVTPDQALVYVSNSALWGGSPSVSVISTANNQILATVPVGNDPQQIAFLPNGRFDYFAYVANQLSDTVSVIDTASNTVVETIPVLAGPLSVATVPQAQRGKGPKK